MFWSFVKDTKMVITTRKYHNFPKNWIISKYYILFCHMTSMNDLVGRWISNYLFDIIILGVYNLRVVAVNI